MKQNDKVNTIVFFIIAAIVVAGFAYGLFSGNSILNKHIKAAPWYMNALGAIIFVGGGISAFLFGTGRVGTGDSNKDWIPVVVSIAIAIVGGLTFAANFFNAIV